MNDSSSDRNPVENIYWFEAVTFCNRLSLMEKLPPYYGSKAIGANPARTNWPGRLVRHRDPNPSPNPQQSGSEPWQQSSQV